MWNKTAGIWKPHRILPFFKQILLKQDHARHLGQSSMDIILTRQLVPTPKIILIFKKKLGNSLRKMLYLFKISNKVLVSSVFGWRTNKNPHAAALAMQKARVFLLTQSGSSGSNVVRGQGNCNAQKPCSGKDSWIPQGRQQLAGLPLEATEKKILPLTTGLKFWLI